MTSNAQNHYLYAGTSIKGDKSGIYIFRLDSATGALEQVSFRSGVQAPSFLTIAPQGNHLYSVGQIEDKDQKTIGTVHSFSIDRFNGKLTHINHKPSYGDGPCYVTMDHTGSYVLVANYGSGSVCMLPVQGDGSLAEATSVVQHEGSSINPARQQGPHAHSINIDLTNRYAFAPDLGTDKIMVYLIDRDKGVLVPNTDPWVATLSGAGPRHFDFHPNKKNAYVINEIDSTITAYQYDGSSGHLEELQTISALPDYFNGENTCADVHVHPSGKFLYGSNRGHDSLVMFHINQTTGKLKLIGYQSTYGQVPRNFTIDPSGIYLLVANQNSDAIVTFRIDQDVGTLKHTGCTAEVPEPVCLKFLVPKKIGSVLGTY